MGENFMVLKLRRWKRFMKRLSFALVILSPAFAFAQRKDPDIDANLSVVPVASVDAGVLPSAPSPVAAASLNYSQLSGHDFSVKSTKPPKPVPKGKRPVLIGSMVGYIDDAIVASQVRVRFDAAFNDNRPDRAEFFYAAGVDISDVASNTINFQQLYLNAEYAPTTRFSFFTQIPIRWVQSQSPESTTTPNAGGLSDIQGGLKFAAISSDSRYLTFQLRAYFPTGDGSERLGTNHYSIEPMVLYYQQLSDRAAVEAQVGDTHPIGGSTAQAAGGFPGIPPNKGFAGDVFTYGIGPSYRVINRDTFHLAPVVELVGWHVIGGLQTATSGSPNADGINIVNLKVGARATFTKGNSVYLGYGHALTSEVWYTDLVRVEYRHTF
jgi:hypothetical protein